MIEFEVNEQETREQGKDATEDDEDDSRHDSDDCQSLREGESATGHDCSDLL